MNLLRRIWGSATKVGVEVFCPVRYTSLEDMCDHLRSLGIDAYLDAHVSEAVIETMGMDVDKLDEIPREVGSIANGVMNSADQEDHVGVIWVPEGPILWIIVKRLFYGESGYSSYQVHYGIPDRNLRTLIEFLTNR